MKKTLLVAAIAALTFNLAYGQCPAGEVQVIVSISTDAYGSETTWTLAGGGTSYASGGPYTDHPAAGAFPEAAVSVCIPIGTEVTFTINDAYGDGMCCAYGEGHYDVSMNGCNTVAEGGEYADSETTTFTTVAPAAIDLAVTSVNLPAVMQAGTVQIAGQLKNVGSTTINSYDLNYSVDGGSTMTQSISTAIASCATYAYTHSSAWNATVGSHEVMVWVSNVNGGTDGNATNDAMTVTTSIATQTVARVVTIEEFGSSTCPPCFPFADNFTPAVESFDANAAGSNLAVIEYHMDWPSPGNDRSFNPDGDTRRGYYGVSGIPSPWIEGHEMNGYSTADITSEIASLLTNPAFMNLDVTTTYNGNDITVNAVVTPRFNAPVGYKLYIAVTEDFYSGATTVSGYNPYDFHYTQRKMLPNGGGSALAAFVADQPQTITQSYSLVSGNPQQGNFELWGDVSGVTVVAFVQKTATKEIAQGAISSEVVGIDELNANNSLLNIYPNPTTGLVSLRYGKSISTPVFVEVYNVLGDRVMESNRDFSTGSKVQTMDLSALNNGVYLLSVTADGVRSTRTINVNK